MISAKTPTRGQRSPRFRTNSMALGVRLAACSVSLVCPRTRAGNEVRSSYGALASTTPRACLDGQNGSQSRVSFGLAPRGKSCGIPSSAQGAALSKRVAELEAEVQQHKQHAGNPNKMKTSAQPVLACSLLVITPHAKPFLALPQRTGETKATNVRHSLEPLSLFAAAHQHHTQPS